MFNSATKPSKNSFKLEKNRNGSILSFHNTTNNDGNIVRIRLINACFNYNSTQVVTIDHRGSIYVLDLTIKKIWKIFDKCKRSTVVQHNPFSLNEYFIGTKDGEIIIIDIEKGRIIKSKKFCSFSIETISIPTYLENSDSSQTFVSPSILSKHFLIATCTEAILIDIKTLQANYKLEFDTGSGVSRNVCFKQTSLKFVSYFPNSEKIFACFTNDSVHIWSTLLNSSNLKNKGTKSRNIGDVRGGGDGDPNTDNTEQYNSTQTEFENQEEETKQILNLKTIRIFYPLKLRDRQIKQNKGNEYNEIKLSDKIDYDYMNTKTTNVGSEFAATIDEDIVDFSQGLIESFEFSLDGNYICLTTLDGYILLLSPITLEIIKIIRTKDFSIKKCLCFERNVHGIHGEYTLGQRSSKVQSPIDLIGIAVTSQSDIILIDFNDFLVKTIILSGGCTYKMNLSYNGKLLFAILKTGELRIFQTSIALNVLITTQKNIGIINKPGKTLFGTNENVILTNELKNSLSKERLLPILKEYGSYSSKYRHLIWTTLLNLPSNKQPFTELLRKGIHPAVLKYDQEFPIKDATLLRNLKKISSCLIFWSKIFAECEFLPKFVFPFLKIFPNNSLLTFELIATILYNQCQLWFEFAPIEPLNYLGLIENALHYFDFELYKFYRDREITTKTYAWPLLTTCFSEVLDEQYWYQLWDNILTKDIEYIIFIVLAYQLIQRNIIMRLDTNESIELFFHEQYIIDMQKLLRKANNLMEKCPIELHPRRYLKTFNSLPKGFYPKFENYPKEWFELKDREMEAIRIENYILDEKIRNLELEEIQLAKRLEEGLKDEETQRRLKDLEKLYCGAISREEERIACQRKMVLMYQMETRNRRRKVLDMVRHSMNRKNINLHENQLDTLMRNIERTRLRDETDMMLADEDLKDRELNLLSQIYKIKSNTIVDNNYVNRTTYPEDIGAHHHDDDDDNDGNTNANATTTNINVNHNNTTCNDDIFKSRSMNNNSRTIITRTAGLTFMDESSRLAKEFKKRNNIIHETYGVQLNTKSNSAVVNKHRTIENIQKKKKRNFIDRTEEILNQIQLEYQNIVDPATGSS